MQLLNKLNKCMSVGLIKVMFIQLNFESCSSDRLFILRNIWDVWEIYDVWKLNIVSSF